MIFDTYGTFADDVSAAAEAWTGVAANVDMGSIGADASHGNASHGIGVPAGLWVYAWVGTAWTGGGSVIVTVETDTTDPRSGVTTLLIGPTSGATPAAGTTLLLAPLPIVTQRYLGVSLAWTTAETAGTFSAKLIGTPQAGVPSY